MARGPILRDVTVNLVVLRRLARDENDQSTKLRRYMLGLSLAIATRPVDGFLRQGCLLTLDSRAPRPWEAVKRDGSRVTVGLDDAAVLSYAKKTAKAFGVGQNRTVTFDTERAKADVNEPTSKQGKGGKVIPQAVEATDGENGG